ncbi:hypothetical protein GEMRC1_001045 [Eukaryota sp. GEM-RC1]
MKQFLFFMSPDTTREHFFYPKRSTRTSLNALTYHDGSIQDYKYVLRTPHKNMRTFMEHASRYVSENFVSFSITAVLPGGKDIHRCVMIPPVTAFSDPNAVVQHGSTQLSFSCPAETRAFLAANATYGFSNETSSQIRHQSFGGVTPQSDIEALKSVNGMFDKQYAVHRDKGKGMRDKARRATLAEPAIKSSRLAPDVSVLVNSESESEFEFDLSK